MRRASEASLFFLGFPRKKMPHNGSCENSFAKAIWWWMLLYRSLRKVTCTNMRKNINHQLLVFRAVPVECKQCICNARIDACGRGKKMLNCSRDKNQVAHSSDGGRGIGEKCLLCDYPDLSYERRELEKYHGIGRRYRQLLLIIWYWYRMGEKSKKNRTRNRHYHRHHRHDVIIN